LNGSNLREMNDAIIVVGSNILPVENTRVALTLLKQQVNCVAVSHTWETQSVGAEGPNYLNTGVRFFTSMNAIQIKNELGRPIETRLGRVRTENKFAPRTIDLDLILFNGKVLDQRLWSETYLAIPISELVPDLIQPETGEKLNNVAKVLLERSFAQIHLEI
jgi:2-amino-4-hydroxy-6-hydroxymethyldihydropteridine diphosphokinase